MASTRRIIRRPRARLIFSNNGNSIQPLHFTCDCCGDRDGMVDVVHALSTKTRLVTMHPKCATNTMLALKQKRAKLVQQTI